MKLITFEISLTEDEWESVCGKLKNYAYPNADTPSDIAINKFLDQLGEELSSSTTK